VLNQIRLVVFDLDYLIFDCAEVKMRALRAGLVSLDEDIPHSALLPDVVVVEEAFRDHGCRWVSQLDIGLDEAALDRLQINYRMHEERLVSEGVGQLFLGLIELVSDCRMHGLLPAIGAEASRDYLMAVSDRHGLDPLFEMVYCTEEYGMGGADEMIEEIMSRVEVNPNETIALGTRPGFFRAARRLDVLSIGCGWGLHQLDALADADLQAPALTDLLFAIEKADEMATRFLS
jgi:phosphoglycolate phosphatase-like HAD superfamily hydrolase